MPKYENGPLPKVKEDVSKIRSKKSKTDPKQKDVGNKVKDKTVPPNVGHSDSQMNIKVPSVPENHSVAPKRKKANGESNSVTAVKMKKTAVENRKPTE